MTADVFRPFETQIEREAALTKLREAVAGADDGELFLERRRAESLVFDDGRVKTASYDAAQGFGLRAVRGEVAGYAHSSEISEAAMGRAVETARLAVGDGGGTMADAPSPTNKRLYSDADPIAGHEFPVKLDTLREIDAYLRDMDPRVVQVTATIAASLQEVVILRADGHEVSDTRPMARLNISVIVEKDGRRETGSVGGGGRVMLDGLIAPEDWQAKAREALRVALVNLEAEAAPAGVMDVVLGPGWPGILLHEAIGHGLEGDFNRKGSSTYSGRVGEKVASELCTIVDDGTIAGRRGSLSMDDEGVPGGFNTLIRDGVLVGYMQDKHNAGLMGVAPTGNGRRESFAHLPMPRMTNTYMLPGNDDPAAILGSVDEGIFAANFDGGSVDITSGNFVFSASEAYRIEGGRLGAPIKGVTLIGNGPDVLEKVSMVGNDLALDTGIGVCGKNGQSVPVGVGQPTLRVDGLTVGGTQG